MKIYFSPEYTSDTYINLDDCDGINYDVIVTGVEGLVSLIELYLGIHTEVSPQIDRQAQWMICMRQVMGRGTNDLTESWSKNALGVSNECLAWRDLLRMAKWTHDMRQPADRFRIIAEADKLYTMPSTGDRIMYLLQVMDRNPFAADTIIYVGANTATALMPAVAELLGRMAATGVEVVYDSDSVTATPDSNLAKAQRLLCSGEGDDSLTADDHSFRIWEFDTANDACRYIASLPKDAFDLVVLSDGKLLDNTQQMLGQPTSGTSVANSAPQIAQMFMLGMNLFEYPLNINNLLAWMQLPLHPIKSDLRHALVRVIVETTGFDNDKYSETIDSYLESLPDDKERQKVRQTLDTFDVRPSQMVDMSRLRDFNNALYGWAAQMSAIEDIEESKRQQLYAVSTLCRTLNTLLADIPEAEIPYRRLEAAISTMYNGSEFRIYDAQAGARHTAGCANIASATDRILWGDCYNYTPGRSPYDFLNNDERRHFAEQGCAIQDDNDCNRAAIRALTMPVLRARKQCVIVTVRRCGGKDTTEHPIMIQLKKKFEHTLENVTETPSPQEFETHQIAYIDNHSQAARIEVSCPLPMPDHESYSSLDMLIQYPLDYVLEKIARIYTMASTDLKQVNTVKGDVAHKVIERLFVGNAEDIASRISNEYDLTLDEVIKHEGAVLLLPENELDCKQFRSELLENLSALLEIIQANNLTVVGREHEINTNIGLLETDDPGMKGFIDMVLADADRRLYVFDFKWTGSRSYHSNLLKENLSLQLALYQELLRRTSGRQVAACAYFTMPRHEMFTVSTMLNGSNVVTIVPENTDDLVAKAINSYRYRRRLMESGIIDLEEGMDFGSIEYMECLEKENLFPLKKEYGNENVHDYNKFSNYSCFKNY